jgi:uncharacterized membrane-anchored protein
MKTIRILLVVAGLALILGLSNWTIAGKRQVIAEGKVLLLELAPVDPRSLMQGDYMALAMNPNTMPDEATMRALPYRGTVILALDAAGVGKFARLDDGGALAAGEMRIKFRRHDEDWRGPRLDYGAQSFFFQEGQADAFAVARYAVLKVAADGGTVLTDLADENRAVITPPKLEENW